MEKEPAHRMPKSGRYPLFFIGLLIIIFGNLAAYYAGFGINVAAPVSIIGFVLLLASVAIR